MNPSLPAAPPHRGVRIAWPHVVLGVIGILLSLYAIYAHVRIEAGLATGCSVSETISCDDVIGSKWGKFLGIPLGYFGAVFWVIVILTGISGAQTSVRSAKLQALGVATVGLVTSIGLAYIAEFVLHKICPICSGTHLTALANFIYATWAWIKLGRRAPDLQKELPTVSVGEASEPVSN